MNKFVKLEGHEGWFLFMDHELDMDQVINFNKRSYESVISKFLKSSDDGTLAYKQLEINAKFLMNNNIAINYNEVIRKYGEPIVIRESGSWMRFHDHKIIETVVSNHFSWPIIEKSNIVICENDMIPEQWWVEYLTNRFPDQSITTLNCFSERTLEDLKENLEFPTIITFTTTFTRLQWFENLINAIQYQKGKTLIIHWKGNDTIWENVRLEFKTQIENFERHNKIEIYKY